jgi:CBS-domain-containing membrane protein
MRKLDPAKVREFTVTAEHVVHPDTSPVEVVLQLYRGANNLPVVEREGGKLVGMVSAREVLAALQTKEKR